MVETRWHFRLPQLVIEMVGALALEGEVKRPDRIAVKDTESLT